VVTHWYGYDLAVLKIDGGKLGVQGRLEVGPEPRGVAISQDGKTAYVAVGVSNEVVRVDVDAMKVTGRLAVGREPRGIAISPDGSSLLVGNSRSQDVSVISTAGFQVERTIPIEGDNLRQVAFSPDGKQGYVANMKNRRFATTANNIDLGWVLGQRLTRVEIDGSEPYATISLDPRGKAAADAHGMAVSKDGTYLAIGLGVACAELGHRVYFTTVQDLARRLAKAVHENKLHRELHNFTRPKLLIIDEVGYLTLDPAQASLLFQVIAQRYPKFVSSQNSFVAG